MDMNFDNIMAMIMKDPRISKLVAASSDLGAIKDAILQIVEVAQHLKAVLAEHDNK